MCFSLRSGLWPRMPPLEEARKGNVLNIQKLLTPAKRRTHYTRHKLKCQKKKTYKIEYSLHSLSNKPKEKYFLL